MRLVTRHWWKILGAAALVWQALMVIATPVRADERDEERADEVGRSADASIAVTIRPRYEELKDGYVEDAIIETADGHFMLFTGRYMQDPGPKFRLKGSDRRELSGLLFDLDDIVFGTRPATPDLRRYGLARDAIGLQLGPRYQDMSFDEISLSFGRDPYADVKGFGSGGILQSRNLWEPYDLADQVLGDVNFSSQSGAPPPLRLSVLLQKALELLSGTE